MVTYDGRNSNYRNLDQILCSIWCCSFFPPYSDKTKGEVKKKKFDHNNFHEFPTKKEAECETSRVINIMIIIIMVFH